MAIEVQASSAFAPSLLSTVIGLCLAWLLLGDLPRLGSRYRKLPGAPVVGAAFSFEPGWFTRYRYTLSGWSIVQQGWENVRSGIFTIIRPESNVTVIPRRYIDELAKMPDSKLAAVETIVNDMMRQYTGIDILLQGHLGPHAVKNKLTPQLDMLVDIIQEELTVAAEEDPLPVTNEWSEQKLWPYASKLMARITSRLFVGIPLCRDEAWLKHNSELVRAIFETAVVMRNLPRFLHPLVGAIVPSRRRLQKKIKQLHEFLLPLIKERQKKQHDSSFEKPQDVMQWMMDAANEDESVPENLSTRFSFTILGSVQTVVEVILNCFYELSVRPEYIPILREEMADVLESGWSKQAAAKLVKADSFIKETFRHYPPSALAFRRLTKEEIVLSDGLVLPKDTYVCIATTSPAQDGLEDTDLDKFDGLRYYKKRMLQANRSAAYDYSSTDKNHISFGHGRYACPGRFAAAIEIKMILAHMLLQYDLKLTDGHKDRPQAMRLLEFQFLNPNATVMLRNRADAKK